MGQNLTRMYLIGLVAFVLFLSTLVGVPVLPRLSAELGAGPAEIPMVVSAALATVVAAQLFTGTLADRYAARTLILAGALVGGLSSLLSALAGHWTELLALRVLGGLADAIAMPALLAITARLGAGQPGRFFGILRGSQGLSFVVGPALGSLLSLASLRAPFVVDGVVSLVACVAALALMPGGERAPSEHHLGVLRALRATFSSGRVYLCLLMGVAGSFAYGILSGFVPARAQSLDMAAWQIGLIASGGALVFSAVSYGIGPLTDRLGRRPFLLAAQAIIVASGAGLAFARGLPALAGLYWLFCAGETITYLLCFVYASELFREEHVGASMGAFDSVLDLSLLLGPAAAISLHRWAGTPTPAFLLAVLPAALALFVLPGRLPRRAAAP